MSVLSTAMRQSIASVAGTQLLPGTRVSFKDREDPKPLEERLKATVIGIHLWFDGEQLDLDAVGLRWDGDNPFDPFQNITEDILQKDELDQLEIIP